MLFVLFCFVEHCFGRMKFAMLVVVLLTFLFVCLFVVFFSCYFY